MGLLGEDRKWGDGIKPATKPFPKGRGIAHVAVLKELYT
jgi:hypothetical protein